MLRTGSAFLILINRSWISLFFKFLYSFVMFSKWTTQALYVNPVCLKCISDINVSPATKNSISNSTTLSGCYPHVKVFIHLSTFLPVFLPYQKYSWVMNGESYFLLTSNGNLGNWFWKLQSPLPKHSINKDIMSTICLKLLSLFLWLLFPSKFSC